MRLITQRDYLRYAESTLASTKRTQSADVPSCVTHLLKEMARVRNTPESLLNAALDAVSSADFGDLVGTAERYARLDPAAQSNIREIRADTDPIVIERTGVEALATQFEKYYLRDSVLESNMLEKSTRERIAAKLAPGTSIAHPPTYTHGLDVRELATNATSRAIWDDADRRHAMALARSCVASSLMEEDMMNTVHGKASFSGLQSAKHVAGVAANAPSYDVVHLTYSEFVRYLSNQYEPSIVDLLPLCSNGERCECSRAEARAEGRVTPDPAPLANAMNGHAPVVSRSQPPPVNNPDGDHPQYQQTNLSAFSPSTSGISSSSSSSGGGSNSRHDRRFIGRTFYPPSVLAEVARLYSDAEGADNSAALQRLSPGECLRCHWKYIHTCYHSIGMDQLSIRTGEEGHVPPLNRFSVAVNCSDGFRADMCLPRLRNGLPSNICGDVPIYNEMLITYKRSSVPDLLDPTRTKKIHTVQLSGMDFRQSSQK
jgi:hypothetical protein